MTNEKNQGTSLMLLLRVTIILVPKAESRLPGSGGIAEKAILLAFFFFFNPPLASTQSCGPDLTKATLYVWAGERNVMHKLFSQGARSPLLNLPVNPSQREQLQWRCPQRNLGK